MSRASSPHANRYNSRGAAPQMISRKQKMGSRADSGVGESDSERDFAARHGQQQHGDSTLPAAATKITDDEVCASPVDQISQPPLSLKERPRTRRPSDRDRSTSDRSSISRSIREHSQPRPQSSRATSKTPSYSITNKPLRPKGPRRIQSGPVGPMSQQSIQDAIALHKRSCNLFQTPSHYVPPAIPKQLEPSDSFTSLQASIAPAYRRAATYHHVRGESRPVSSPGHGNVSAARPMVENHSYSGKSEDGRNYQMIPGGATITLPPQQQQQQQQQPPLSPLQLELQQYPSHSSYKTTYTHHSNHHLHLHHPQHPQPDLHNPPDPSPSPSPSSSPSPPQTFSTPLPPTTIEIDWTSPATRRREYAKIDAEHSGLRALWRRCMPRWMCRRPVRQCFYNVGREGRGGDGGSVRRFRVDVKGEGEE
ncbi:hypothetical protein K402DRAFT_163772 [Aulographum hederae CBS 113979]|uniref:Uncharacterized protein n=1 Tax=Aulographum hederae CBS 113979 TaxID=1176131 RepID=A0A6G1GS00_9PEZI|nr:hypothetical protein K402DRAFT_163772 [Aulographum hederae CBS 113979]